MLEVRGRIDGNWNVWSRHYHEAASIWQVIHVANSRAAALRWIKDNG